MKKAATNGQIDWKDWSEESFEEARREGRLILLDLTASWCHWCHVMDEKTYSDPDIALVINERFVPIRVDIDRRPDVSDRYNRGGFPTTAFLSDHGESIWGATFIPPLDMMRIMKAILVAQESGEIGRALERSRSIPDRDDMSLRGPSVDNRQLSELLEDIVSVYDTEFGGFGSDPKFPSPDVLDLLMMMSAETGDHGLAEAALHTLRQMASGLNDRVDGGLFRYSVTRDWQTPHYEKMLETNAGFLRNLAHAYGVFGDPGLRQLAKTTADYMRSNLLDHDSGGFYGSQDADEEYYKLSAVERRNRAAPSIDMTVYAGWNCEASVALRIAGSAFGDEDLLVASRHALEYAVKHLWNPRLKLVRHVESEDVYLFEDQVSFLSALVANLGESREEYVRLGEGLIDGVNRHFSAKDGRLNDIVNGVSAIGELGSPKTPLVQNSNWALATSRFGTLIRQPDLVAHARRTLESFSLPEIETYGIFGASYIMARRAVEKGFAVVEIHIGNDARASENRMVTNTWKVFDPTIVPMTLRDDTLTKPFAVVCTSSGCSRRIFDSDELEAVLSDLRRSRQTT